MPKIKLNGREIEVAAGKTVIQACFDNGVFVPHYCWHPGLTPAGNCRMCLVKATPPLPPAGPPQEKAAEETHQKAVAALSAGRVEEALGHFDTCILMFAGTQYVKTRIDELKAERTKHGGPVQRGLSVSCMMPVSEGLDVVTESPEVDRARREIMEFLLINHPLD